MKIDQTGSVSGLPPSTDARNRLNARAHSSDSQRTDVKLSPLSATLQKAEASMAQSPVVSNSRVNEIKQAIAEGRFEVSPERIAGGLLDSVREMLSGSAAVSS